MSIHALKIVFAADIKGWRKPILIALAHHADDDGGNCYPWIKTIAAESGCSKITVKRELRDLVKDGLATRSARYAPNGGRTSDDYRLNLEAIAKLVKDTTPPHLGDTTPPHLGDTTLPTWEIPPSPPSRGGGWYQPEGDNEESFERSSERSVEREVPAAPQPTEAVKKSKSKRKGRPSTPATVLAADWTVGEADRAYARDQGLDNAQIGFQEKAFREHWRNPDTKNREKSDWPATWRKWILKAIGWAKGVSKSSAGPRDGAGERHRHQASRGSGDQGHRAMEGLGGSLPGDPRRRSAGYRRLPRWQIWPD